MADYPFYKDQLSFLFDGGRGMSRAHPRDADMLAGHGDDPDVERILEGVAFIVGKVFEKQFQNLPELSQFLFDLLFPHYLCPVPATAIVEFSPAEWGDCVPRGTEVLSVPVRGTACRFRTAYDVDVGPLSIDSVTWTRTGAGGDLTISFSGADAMEKSSSMEEDRIRLYFHGEPLVTTTLYHWLTNHLDGVRILDHEGQATDRGRGISVRPLGLSEEESLLNYPEGSFPGFRLLQEYFSQLQKFLFVDVEGVWSALQGASPPGDRFSLVFQLSPESPRNLIVDKRHIRLGCTPVVNLFSHTADPINRVFTKAEFPVRPAGLNGHYQVYRVLDVLGATLSDKCHYPILSELEHSTTSAFSQVHRKRKQDGEVRVSVSLSEPEDTIPPDDQILLVDLLCSNGMLPLGLRVGDINRVSAPFERLSCQNITAVTPPAPVPMGEDLRYRLVSHLALTQLDLATLEGFHETIDLYNLQALGDEQVAWAHNLLLEGLMNVHNEERHHRFEGIPIRGRSTLLEIGEKAFSSEGELYLFGCILNEFVALQTPLNWFSEFGLRWNKTKRVYRWPRRLGRELLS